MMNEIAIIMAAGLGTRMKPLTDKVAKPLVKVNGVPLIETVIEALMYRGVSSIYIITGYKREMFGYLGDKFACVTLIENGEYTFKNNISSIHAAINCLGVKDTFICEADLFIKNKSFLGVDIPESCYFGKFVPGHSDDWIFEIDKDGWITRVGVGGDDLYNMVGISYLTKGDSEKLREFVLAEYKNPGHECMFWDDVVNKHIDEFRLKVRSVSEDEIVEIDTVEELCRIDRTYERYLHDGGKR